MEGQEAMAFPGANHQPFYMSPSLRPMLNPNLHHPYHQEEFFVGHEIQSPPSNPVVVPETEPVVKKKRGRPRKYVPESDDLVALGLCPMDSSHKVKNSGSSMSADPNEPKRARGRPRGTGRKQRLADPDVGPMMNDTAGHAFAPHVISVEPGEDVVSKVLSFSQQRPRALCIMSASGTVSEVIIRRPGSSEPILTFQGSFEILRLGGSYLVNEEGGPKTRTGGMSVSFSRADGFMFGGGIHKLIAASLVQVVACSFVYGKAKANKQDNGTKEHETNMETTPTSEPSPPPPATEGAGEVKVEAEADHQTPQDYSSPGWAGSGGGNRTIDSRNHNHITDFDLTRG